MKLGFSLKKAKKKPLLGAAAAESAGGAFEDAKPAVVALEKVFVTAFDPSAPAVAADGAKALVIPLIAANEWREAAEDDRAGPNGSFGPSDAVSGELEASGGEGGGGGAARTADETAAEAVLAEARGIQADVQAGSSSSFSSSLVIPMADAAPTASDAAEEVPAREETARDKKKAALFQDAAQRMQAAGAKPILQQNAVPGLDKLADVKDKYRHDISLRPDALDVHSEAYAAVPIEEFGAAMLRGMGWKGSVGQDEDADAAAPKPRHKLLGLGATMRPPLAGDKKKRRKKHTSRANKEEPPPSSQRQAGMNRADDNNKRRRSGSSERRTRDDSHGRSDKDEHKRRHRDGDERGKEWRSASSRDRSRSRGHHDSDRKSGSRRDSRDRRDNDRKSDDRRDSRDHRDDDRKDTNRRRRERSRSGDRDRDHDRHRSSRR